MALYVIGDVQGCYDELAELLDSIRFDPAADRIWFVGDLVNRGPRSLEVLRLVRSLDANVTMVHGNHDLHLLSLDAGHGRPRADDTLDEVLAAFPDKRFLINIKANDPRDGELLAERLLKLPPEQFKRLMSYGGDRPMATLRARIPTMKTTSRKSVVACATGYLTLGWAGHIPDACRNTIILVPVNMGWLGWGWPNRFLERMHAVGTEVYVTGPYTSGDPGAAGVDTDADFAQLPENFSGGIWTNRIDRIGPKFNRAAPPNAP